MAGVSFGLVDFVSGGPILDLPVMEGASWAAQLNRPDAVSCTVDLNDPDALALDLRSSTEPNKTVLFARTDDDIILAWGIIGDDGREWDEDSKTLSLTATGITGSWLASNPIAPVAALTAPLITLDAEGFPQVNPALDTTLAGWSHGTIGKKLVEQLLAWPGAPTVFDLPPDEPGTREQTYLFSAMKSIGSALDDLTKQEGGPDFAFDASRGPDGLTLRYIMRHGSEEKPRIGTEVGVWSLGKNSPITGLKLADAVAAGASVGWMTAGKSSGVALISRMVNTELTAAGYPPLALVDTSHNDVSVQATLDSYNAENMRDAASTTRDVSFNVRADASPALGQYRPGDTVKIDVPLPTPAGDWIETRRNLIPTPEPATIAGSGWIGAPTAVVEDAWVEHTPTGAATPYIFTSSNTDLIPAGSTVYGSIEVRNDSANFEYMRINFRESPGVAYMPPINVVSAPLGQVVRFEWSLVVDHDIAPGTLHLSVVPSTAGGAFINPPAGSKFRARRPLLSVTPGPYFTGGSNPYGENERTRWEGAAGSSASILEERTPADPGHPYISEGFEVRITSIEGDETGLDVKIGCVIVDA